MLYFVFLLVPVVVRVFVELTTGFSVAFVLSLFGLDCYVCACVCVCVCVCVCGNAFVSCSPSVSAAGGPVVMCAGCADSHVETNQPCLRCFFQQEAFYSKR